jgi:hypothetical protein
LIEGSQIDVLCEDEGDGRGTKADEAAPV